MKQVAFTKLPQEYELAKNQIQEDVLQRLYSKFTFLYFTCSHFEINNDDTLMNEQIESFLYGYLHNFKFLTFHITNLRTNNKSNSILQKNSDIYICIEDQCLIIEKIKLELIKKIMNNLRDHNVSILNISSEYKIWEESKSEKEAEEEVSSFSHFFSNKIKTNKFVKYTIIPIVGYLIRRHFFPSNYFKDQSFFHFRPTDPKEDEIKSKLSLFLLSKNEQEKKANFEQLKESITTQNQSNEEWFNKEDFHENDFISLRSIFARDSTLYFLVFHLKTFHVFLMKKVPRPISIENDYEANFCENYSNRCMTPFYGFLKKEQRIVGFIYEFMSNGSLTSYFSNNKEKVNNLFLIITLNRIIQGIKYLHSNSFIHRDFKPSNILLDHDFRPYISDFETIRHPSDEQEEMTNNIGSALYFSPEQENGNKVSYGTDIYSFGLSLYFMFEKKHFKNQKNSLPLFSNAPECIKHIVNKCIELNPSKRPTIQEIKSIFIKEMNPFEYLLQHLLNASNINVNDIVQYILEYLIILKEDSEKMEKFFDIIWNFYTIYQKKVDGDESSFYLILGNIYENGCSVKQDYSKAAQYYEISASKKNPEALSYLGSLLLSGDGVKQDYVKAKKYCELAAQYKDSGALYLLGTIYVYGYGVEQNFLKAKAFYELAIKQNNSKALFNLSLLYKDGLGVKKNIKKAIEYLNLASQLNNPDAQWMLGNMHSKGIGFVQNYSKAIEFYELAAQQNHMDALYELADIYLKGFGVKKDVAKAIHYLELSAEQGNSDALLVLGNCYLLGYGTKKDYTKAREYFELSVKLDNPDAYVSLGNIYLCGLDVEKNYLKAKEYYELAVKHENSGGYLQLGDIYFYGYGVKQDYTKAIEYYELAASQNNPDALLNLGKIYQKGKVVPKDEIKSKMYFDLYTQMNGSGKLGNISVLDKEEFEDKDEFLVTENYVSTIFIDLGLLYENGKVVEQDYSKAKEYYELAASNNNSYGYIHIGNLYKEGLGVDKDFSKAKEYFEIAAKMDNSEAFISLGTLYLYGYGVEKNATKAKEYYELAASKNNSSALICLGQLYEEGNGVDKNYSKAKKYYEMAAQQDNKEAYLFLSGLYTKGRGVERDLNKAKELFDLSSLSKKNDSIYPADTYALLGDMYSDGEGVEQNFLKAIEYYELAVKFGNEGVYGSLGYLYSHSNCGAKKDYVKARKYYELAANQDNSSALNNLGIFYENGYGVDKDYSKAKEYYEKAAKLDNADGYNNLGLLYENGLGVSVDYLRAKSYYLLASKQDHDEALLNLGNLYKNGKGVKQNYKQAHKYYELSAEQGNSEALLNLGLLYENGLGVKQSYSKAKNFYLQSAKQSNSYAYLNLGKFYYNGTGVEQNYKKALEYYQLSSQQNNSEAFFFLGYFYSVDDAFEKNIYKAIQYLLKCIDIPTGVVELYNSSDGLATYQYKVNNYYYPSFNDLGLIYLTVFQDIEKAEKYIKEAGLNEYPFGQNNFGLMCQLYFNKIGDAEYLYEKASKSHFSLAEYNLGHLYELNGNPEKSIKYYIKASEDEDQPLVFHDIEHHDKLLEISKIFIIALTNLKLVEYYFILDKYEESKEYFMKLISELEINTEELEYYFQFHFKDENSFEYLKTFILNYPSFKMENQSNLSKARDSKTNEKQKEIPINKKMKIENKDIIIGMKEDLVFEDPGDLFDFIIKDTKIKSIFINEVKEIIDTMNTILYTPPYRILFGRINIDKLCPIMIENSNNQDLNEINESFYDGLDLII
ncbi:hypothetical protein M9Y10_030259 [Tritrichomonas musculus]|uniref:Protein kinase domain-containing protein n=1 Tax=Tritrichomonas musculus TaxID=1915356 RepID=A0ABR2KPC0_9EUKA